MKRQGQITAIMLTGRNREISGARENTITDAQNRRGQTDRKIDRLTNTYIKGLHQARKLNPQADRNSVR